MTTSLAAQLKKLALPDAQISLSADFKQASFLYDDREAAKYDKQHFYNIGVNGLQQLIAKDARFSEFENNLFSPSSQSIQRLMQSAEVNKQLDEIISKFLLLLSPYMQLREAHKALEWLVNRYNIHLRNVDVLMMCLLPFHDQEPFIMGLKLLKMNTKSCNKWKWLESVKNSNSYLPQKTLVSHCRSANGFMGFLCNMLAKHIETNRDVRGHPSAKHLARVISFFTQTVLGVLLEGSPSEQIISILIPTLSAGFKNTALPAYIQSSYMIFGQLLNSCSLSESLLGSSLNVICKNILPDLLQSAISVIVLMFQKQAISKVSKKALKYLSKHHALTSVLSSFCEKVKAEAFLAPFLSALTSSALRKHTGIASSDSGSDNEGSPSTNLLSLLMQMLSSVSLDKKSIAAVTPLVVEWFKEKSSTTEMEVDGEDDFTDGPFGIFRLLEQKYSSILNTVVTEIIQSDESGEIKPIIERLQLRSVTRANKDRKFDPLTFATVCLNHHEASVRRQAVHQILQDATEMQEHGSLQTAIVLRLQDDDEDVVNAVLESPENLWSLFEDKRILYLAMLRKMKSLKKTEKGSGLGRKLLQSICCMPSTESVDAREISVVIISFLIPFHEDDLEQVASLQSSCAAYSPLLQFLKKGWIKEVTSLRKKKKDNDLFSAMTVELAEQIAQFVAKNDPYEEMKSLYDCALKSPRRECAMLVMILANMRLLKLVKPVGVKTKLQRLLVLTLKDLSMSKKCVALNNAKESDLTSMETVVSSCIDLLKKASRLDFDLVAICFEQMEPLVIPPALKDQTFWLLDSKSSTESNWLWTKVTLFNFLLELSSRQVHVSKLAQTAFSELLKTLDFHLLLKMLCGIWIAKPDKQLTVAHQARAMQFAQVYLQSLTKDDKAKVMSDERIPLLPSLLFLMSSGSEKVRHISFNMLVTITEDSANTAGVFNWFASHLLKYRLEVENDVAFLSQVMQNILEEDSSTEPPSVKRKKRSSSKPPMWSTALQHLLNILVNPGTPSIIRLGILNSFGKLDSAESFIPLMDYLPTVLDKSAHVQETNEKAALRLSIKLILDHITPNVAHCLTVDSISMKALQKALASTDIVSMRGDTVQILTTLQLSRHLMSSLPTDSCQIIFSQLLNIMTSTSNATVVRSCRKVIKHMKLHSRLITTEMASVLDKDIAMTVRETKRQRIQAGNVDKDVEDLESKLWKRIVTLLEIIQNKKKIIDGTQLIHVAFQVLGKVLQLESHSSGEYLKQLLLGTIYKICKSKSDDEDNAQTSSSDVTGEHLNMELIVQCIRTSDNPHTHHQALLLLSEAAKIDPNLLLHNMMSVFTFMGANMLRQDDEYSFHVIERILENVIPAIKMACEEKNRSTSRSASKKKSKSKGDDGEQSQEMMTVVLRVFVDAIPHIPSHRKIRLFQKLVTVVGVDDYLWRVLLLVIENVVQRPKAAVTGEHSEEEQTSGPLPTSDLDFMQDLCEAFSSLQYFNCITNAVKYLLQLPEEKSSDIEVRTPIVARTKLTKIEDLSKSDTEIFSIQNHSAKQLRHFKYGSVFTLAQLMTSQHLVAQLSYSDPDTFLTSYHTLMETTLQFIGQVTTSHDQHQQDSSARFWKIFLHKCHDLLDNMVKLLPDSMFITVVSGLMEDALPLVQKRAMDLLNAKLQYYKESGIHAQQKEMLLTVVSKLQTIMKRTLLPKGKAIPKDEDLVNGQTAIYGLKVLCRILGEAHHQPFLEVLKLCVKALLHHEDNGTVCASAMLCVAEVVSTAKIHAIEYLEELVPLVIVQLKMPSLSEQSVLLLAAITSLQKIIEAVPLFLSPFLSKIIIQICTIYTEIQGDSQKPIAVQKIKQICHTLATMTSTRTFLPVMEKAFEALQSTLEDCGECYFSMLKDHIDNMSRDDMSTFSTDLLKFFFVCLSIRSENPEMSSSEVNEVEGFAIEAFIALVFKLSEVQFKPMLLQLYSWATDADADKGRVLTFYRLCSSLADKLKNLFTLFAGHILKHSAEVLDENHKSKTDCDYFGKGKKARRKSCQLIEHILSCLQKTFMHDTEGFMNKERFDVVIQPIIDQLENNIGKSEVVSERVEKVLVPCISSLAASARDDSLWKEMNYQICLKTRHNSEKVRIFALSAIDALHKQLGEDYTQLVPETIPFIAELMEDESDEVEKYTQKVIAAMEISVGENLQEYF